MRDARTLSAIQERRHISGVMALRGDRRQCVLEQMLRDGHVLQRVQAQL